MKRTQKNALAMAGLMTAATLFSAVPAMADDVITVDFWTAPQQVQYNYWEEKAQAFNETKTEVNRKNCRGEGTADARNTILRGWYSKCDCHRNCASSFREY